MRFGRKFAGDAPEEIRRLSHERRMAAERAKFVNQLDILRGRCQSVRRGTMIMTAMNREL